MKKVTTQVRYTPRTAPPVRPTFKAVIIDTEMFVLNAQKVYTYASADFADANTPTSLYAAMKAAIDDITDVTINAKVKAGDTPLDLLTNEDIVNIGFISQGGSLSAYEWAFGLPVAKGPLTVTAQGGEDDNVVRIAGLTPTKEYYIAVYSEEKWYATKLTYREEDQWEGTPENMPAGKYEAGECMVYEDIYGIYNGTTPQPVSIYLTLSKETTDTTYRGKLTEITNYSDIVDMYGSAAIATRGNIAYSAAKFYLQSGGGKSFYIAPMTADDSIDDLIEDMKAYDDAYYLIYNIGSYSDNKADVDALIGHVRTMSSPLYKRERRLYVKEPMVGITDQAVALDKQTILNAALSIDSERVSLIVECLDTDSLIEYCAKRYSVARGYGMTGEPIDIGNIWPQVSCLSRADKEEFKDNGVVFFDQANPMSVPYVLYQTTTYIEANSLDRKEEDIQISIDLLCRTIRQLLEPRIAKGMDNKVTADPASATSKAYIANLNADIAPARREYENEFVNIKVMPVEIDPNDPRNVRMSISLETVKNANRIDITIYAQ